MGCPERRSGMPGSFSTVIAHMEPPSSRKQAKRVRLGPERPLLGPWRSSEGPGEADLIPTTPDWLDSWSPHTLTWYQAPSGPPGALKGPVLAQMLLLETLRFWEGLEGSDLVPDAPDCLAWV